jgi:hypothetical protein
MWLNPAAAAVLLLRVQVRELKKRQQKEREKEVKRREKQLEKEKAGRAAQAKLKMEQEAYQLQVKWLAGAWQRSDAVHCSVWQCHVPDGSEYACWHTVSSSSETAGPGIAIAATKVAHPMLGCFN